MAATVVGAATEKLGYRPGLDGLRAVAALAVVVSHYHLVGDAVGGHAVDVFFTLSGFLITTILLEELAATGRVRLGRFYERRARRLVPCLVAVVAFCALLLPVLQPPTRAGLLPALLYVGNWFKAGGADLGSLDHTWSLAIEEQFYLVWPLVVIATARLARGRMAWVCAALAVSVAVVRMVGGFTPDRMHNGTDLHSDPLLWGAAFAYARAAGWRLSVPALATVSRVLACRPLVWVGKRSYGLYLWHFPIGHIITGQPAVAFAVALLVTECSYRWIEAPFRSTNLHAPEVHAVRRRAGADRGTVVVTGDQLHVVAG